MGASRSEYPRFLGLPGSKLAKAIAHLSRSPSGRIGAETMTVRRSAIAACGSGMESASMGIFICGGGLVAVSVQAAPDASATTDG